MDEGGELESTMRSAATLILTSCLQGAPTTGEPTTGQQEVIWEGRDFEMEIVGSDTNGCVARWAVTPTPASFTCPDCDFTLDWQFFVTFEWSPQSTTAGCDPDAKAWVPYWKLKKKKKKANYEYPSPDSLVRYFNDNAEYFTEYLAVGFNWWAHTSDAVGYYGPGGPGEYMVIGTATSPRLQYGPSLYPAIWDEASGLFGFTRTQPFELVRGWGYVQPGQSSVQ